MAGAGAADREKGRPELIRPPGPSVRRLVASITAGGAAPSHILKKLAAFPRQSGSPPAPAEVGHIERTLFILDWLRSPELRRRVQNGLNKGEARQRAAPAPSSSTAGQVRDRALRDQHHRASGLNLLIAAIVL